MLKEKAVLDRLEYLDSARGIAALTVLLSHFFGAYHLPKSIAYMDSSIFHVFWHGEGAVVFFFVLSGLVLSISFFKDRDKINRLNYTGFLMARIFRIYPLFLAVLMLSILSKYFFLRDYVSTPEASNWILSLWKNSTYFFKQALLIVRVPSDPDLRLLPQDWTLSIELLISATIPFFILICLRRPLWLFLFIFINVAFLKLEPYCLVFTLGVLIACYLTKIVKIWDRLNLVIKLFIFILSVILYSAIFSFPSLPHIINKIFTIVGVVMLLIILLSSKRMQSKMKTPILVFLGKISYSLYLSHFIILICVVPPFYRYINSFGINDEFLTRILGLIILIITTITFSYMLHIMIEKPFVTIGHFINEKLTSLNGKIKTYNVK